MFILFAGMKRKFRFTIIVSMVLLFEALYSLIIVQNSAEKKNLYACSVTDMEKSVALEKKAIKLNELNPLYKLNLCCFYAKLDSIDSDLFKSLAAGGNRNERLDYSLDELVGDIYSMFPYEPVFALNYSLNAMMKGHYAAALEVLEPFAGESYSTREVLLVTGWLNELTGNRDAAAYYFSKAIERFTDITESRFFADLRRNDSALAEQSLTTAVKKLKDEYDRTEDPLVAARLGKLYYTMGDLDKSESLMEWVLREMPSLNRTWYYLGCIKEARGDEDLALEYFKRSYKLDETDVLPIQKLVEKEVLKKYRMDMMAQYSASDQSFRLEKLYGGNPIRFPYIVSDLEQYFSYTITD